MSKSCNWRLTAIAMALNQGHDFRNDVRGGQELLVIFGAVLLEASPDLAGGTVRGQVELGPGCERGSGGCCPAW